MALQDIIPDVDLNQLLCSSCLNYMSIFPIYLTRNKSGGVCGRCTPLKKDDFIRDEAYEAIAQFLLFPCCYKKNGCQEKLTPQKLVHHEVICIFRKFECITKVYTNCEWQGARPDLLEHFKENHPTLLLETPEFLWNFNVSRRENLLMPFKNELFVVKKELDARKQTLSCSVQRFGAHSNVKRYNYIIKCLNANRSAWFKLTEKGTESEENVNVNSDYVKEKLNDPEFVVVQIMIVKTNKEADASLERAAEGAEKNSDLDWELLGELECPVCFDIMCSPIYQCTGGHSICSECKIVLKNCPLCKKSVIDTRNFSLEKLTKFLTYPCKFHKSGCKYVSKSVETKKHEVHCEFGPYDCPLKQAGICHLKMNRSQMTEHIEKNHESFLLKSSIVKCAFSVDKAKECFYFVIFLAKVFRIQYNYENRKFYWTVQLIGTEEESKHFKFDIDVIDNSKSRLRCYLNGFCTSIHEKINFNNSQKNVMLTYEQLEHFIGNTLDYSIHITKE